MACNGDGQCFNQFICDCGCFSDCDCDFDECSCNLTHNDNCLYIKEPQHRECIIFCKFKPELECKCKLLKCNNEFICNNKMPEYVIKRNNGLCDCCYLTLGNLKKDSIKECFICFETKENIALSCNHSLCFDCYEKWAVENENRVCPMCRNAN